MRTILPILLSAAFIFLLQISQPPLSIATAMTDATYTLSSSTCEEQIRSLVEVSEGTGHLTSIDCRQSFSTKCVDLDRNSFQVGRIDAAPNPTKMIYGFSFWNWSNKYFVGDSVSRSGFLSPFGLLDGNMSIPVFGFMSSPFPAHCFGIDLYVGEQSFTKTEAHWEIVPINLVDVN